MQRAEGEEAAEAIVTLASSTEDVEALAASDVVQAQATMSAAAWRMAATAR